MRVLWAPTTDPGNWYPIAPVIAGLVAAGHQVVASGLPAACDAAAALNIPFVAEDPAAAPISEPAGSTVLDHQLEARTRMAEQTSLTLRPLLRHGDVDVVLADPFRYGAGLAARTEGVPWVSYLHHCYLGDPVIDGLFQTSWDGHPGTGRITDAYRAWWAALRHRLGLGAEPRPAGDAWRFAVSDTLTLVLGPKRLVANELPAGGVAIGATPWEPPPHTLPNDIAQALRRPPVVLAAPPADEHHFPILQVAEAAHRIGATLVTTASRPASLPPLPGHVIVHRQLPHTTVMPLVDAVIGGGGWGTTTKH